MSMNRRSFAKYAALAAAGNLAGLRPFGALNALAQTTPGYKALVCIFLYGGNDANNMIIPYDAQGYSDYVRQRGPLALLQQPMPPPLPLVSPHTPNGNFALHPSLIKLQSLYASNNVALVANIGTLLTKTDQGSYAAGKLIPTNLFSHVDQQMEWQNGVVAGDRSQFGWGGLMADKLAAQFNLSAKLPMITSIAGDTLFCNGAVTGPTAVNAGPTAISTGRCSVGVDCSGRNVVAQKLLSFSNGVSLVTADDTITASADSYASQLSAAILDNPLKSTFTGSNQLSSQLQQVARIINAYKNSTTITRQIFFCGVGNFDTHSSQLPVQAALLSEMDLAMAQFHQATFDMGIENSVTSFTMSDFSRTYQPNSNTGSDHAWGSHHIVLGGASSVLGGQMFGTWPLLVLGGTQDVGTNGRWIPTAGSVQYAATLATWFGVSATDLGNVFPSLTGLSNIANPNLNFMAPGT